MNFRVCRLSLLLALAGLCLAQVETSTSISGLVRDPSGALIPGATVTIKNQETGAERTTTTNSAGFYVFPSVPPGTYDVVVAMEGFKRTEVKGRVAQVTAPAQVDVVLEVGQVTESVTVSAAGAELITTTTAEIAGTIRQELVSNLPLMGRNFFDLAALAPGVSPQHLGNQVTFASFSMNAVLGTTAASQLFRSSGVIASGNRDSATNVSVDGVNVQLSVYGQAPPQQPPSWIREVKIHVSNTNAEFGNGAAAVNVITRSGSNEFHGELYEFFRNSALDANYFFNNLNARELPPYRQNQFGGAVGGRIIPNKLFFFGGYEGLRVRRTAFDFQTVPTEALRGGDFSTYRPPAAGGTFGPTPVIYDPLQYNPATGLRSPFPGNRIPQSRFDPVTAKFLQDFVALPNTVIDGIPRVAGTTTAKVDHDQYTARIDWEQSANSRIYGRYSLADTPAVNTGLQSLQGISNDGRSQNAVLHWTRVLSPAAVNDFFAGYSRPGWLYGKRIDVPNVSALIGLRNTSPANGGPNFSGTGFNLNNSNNFILNAVENVFQLGDDMAYVRGRHSFKFGAQLFERRFYYDRYSNDKGFFNFGPNFTRACPRGNSACEAALAGAPQDGNAFADYLLGAPDRILLELATVYVAHRTYFGGYAQDSWRLHPRLTFNYGLRYEYWSPWLVPRNITVSWNETTGEILYALQNPLDYLDPAKGYGRTAPLSGKIPREGYALGKKNFAPRAGLAITLTPRTVLRTSYGIYYDGNVNANQFSNIQTGIAPFFLRHEEFIAGNEQTPPLRVSGNFPYAGPTTIPYPNATPPFSFRYVRSKQRVSMVQQWSASIQRQLSTDWALELAYTGNHLTHQMQFMDFNAPELPAGPYANLSLQQRRRHPQWGTVQSWAPLGSGRYNAGSISLRNNRWRGLTTLTNFTWAKNLVTSLAGVSDIGNSHYKYFDIWRGPAQMTPRLRFVHAYHYELPLGPGKAFGGGLSGLAGTLAGGWALSGNLDFTTGVPNWVTTNDTSGVALLVAMPNRICDARDVPGGRNRFQWFNTACFENPPFGTFGNSHLGVYEDPGIANWNFAVEKATRVGPGEHGRLELRFEFFNFLNHTQWGQAINATLQSGNINAGRILSTRAPRQVQIALQYHF
jgi:hypothetical protein